MDPADAYVRLYDALKGTAGSDLDDWSQEPDVDEAAEQVCEVVLADPNGLLPDHWIPADLAPKPELLAVLLGLDLAMVHARIDADRPDFRTLGYLRSRLQMTGRLNDSTSGTLLFRHRRSGRPIGAPQTLDDLLHLVRIPSGSNIHVEPLSEADDLPDPGLSDDAEGEDPPTPPPIQLAQLPFLAEADDLRWGDVKLQKRSYYTVQPDSSRLRGQPSDAVIALDNCGANVAVLPEASLDDDLLREWQEAVDNGPSPEKTRLAWLLIGTGPVTRVGGASAGDGRRSPNRAVLLTRKGKVLLTQDKQRGFPLPPQKQKDYGLRIGEPPPVHRDEYIATVTDLSLVDSRYGRFGVHICEDVGWHDMRGDVITAGVTHLFVPVLAAPIQDLGWQAQAAMELVKEAGTDVAVSNGLAVLSGEVVNGETGLGRGILNG
ncbi:carbon-nitrogen hydrolase family protein [Streptomyces althioticus]|uniref:nitrilase-related carbon-nitrogen hydrolase n=1 Tax=Streptomyces althioticus TaxID=83380 RepID=UPI00387351C5|nr:carbon-nitrogen hydrolase family protein [Streptomyces althioticus]